ncbi:MAG: hypothetical protein FWC17_01025 [Treponema sp.]|nr:hypothetical protein [Treponema sp.]
MNAKPAAAEVKKNTTAGKTGDISKNTQSNKLTHIRIFSVILTAAVIINAAGIAAGAWFLTRNMTLSIEEHMLIAVDIADQFVSTELELLKYRAAEAAKDIRHLYDAGERDGVLERVCANYPKIYWSCGFQ